MFLKIIHSYKHRFLIDSSFNKKELLLSAHGWFLNKLLFIGHKYQTNGTLRDGNYK